MGVDTAAPYSAPGASATGPSKPLQRTYSQPLWRPDSDSYACMRCNGPFSFWLRRRHHCRSCGELVCADCSPFTHELPHLGYASPVRICIRCADEAKDLSARYTSSEQEEDEKQDLDDGMLMIRAVEVLHTQSILKQTKMSYQYFVKSEAVNWLADAGICRSRQDCAVLFQKLVSEEYVVLKPWKGSFASTFYVLSSELELARVSHYSNQAQAETARCSNCSRSFLKTMAPSSGFCSIDCKTNALFMQADSARAHRYCS